MGRYKYIFKFGVYNVYIVCNVGDEDLCLEWYIRRDKYGSYMVFFIKRCNVY